MKWVWVIGSGLVVAGIAAASFAYFSVQRRVGQPVTKSAEPISANSPAPQPQKAGFGSSPNQDSVNQARTREQRLQLMQLYTNFEPEVDQASNLQIRGTVGELGNRLVLVNGGKTINFDLGLTNSIVFYGPDPKRTGAFLPIAKNLIHKGDRVMVELNAADASGEPSILSVVKY